MCRKIAIALVILWSNAALAADCQTGSYPSLDTWGNKICKRFEDNSISSVQASPDSCPMGTQPWMDQWGNRVCQSYSEPAQQLYDTSAGCPAGTLSAMDNWGNQVCKRI
jgi:hypothetical protein